MPLARACKHAPYVYSPPARRIRWHVQAVSCSWCNAQCPTHRAAIRLPSASAKSPQVVTHPAGTWANSCRSENGKSGTAGNRSVIKFWRTRLIPDELHVQVWRRPTSFDKLYDLTNGLFLRATLAASQKQSQVFQKSDTLKTVEIRIPVWVDKTKATESCVIRAGYEIGQDV